jgi:hypothetical protein
MTTRVEWVEDPARFEALAAPWDALAASQRTPLLLERGELRPLAMSPEALERPRRASPSTRRTGSRLSFLDVDGRPIAFDLAVLDGATLYSLKMSYAPEFEAYSPGSLLRAEVIRRCCELGIAANDLGGGGSRGRTKQRFRTRTIEAGELRLFPRRPAGVACYRRQRAGLGLSEA